MNTAEYSAASLINIFIIIGKKEPENFVCGGGNGNGGTRKGVAAAEGVGNNSGW